MASHRLRLRVPVLRVRHTHGGRITVAMAALRRGRRVGMAVAVRLGLRAVDRAVVVARACVRTRIRVRVGVGVEVGVRHGDRDLRVDGGGRRPDA